MVQCLEVRSAAAHDLARIATKRVINDRLSVCNSNAWKRPRCKSSRLRRRDEALDCPGE